MILLLLNMVLLVQVWMKDRYCLLYTSDAADESDRVDLGGRRIIKKSKKFDFKYLVSLEVFFVILIPHIIWLFNNDFITIKYGFARAGLDEGQLINHLKYPLIFTLKQIGILIPFLILVWLLIKKIPKKLNLKDDKLLFLIFINLVPIVLVFMTALITGSKIRTMWMTTFYLFFGTLFVYLLQAQVNLKKFKPFIIGFIFFFFLSPML